jgi:dihydroorotase
MKRILLNGGRVVDPASGLDEVCDVAVLGSRIQAIGPNLPAQGADIVDCTSHLVLPGLIDTHAHVYEHFTGTFGLNADLCGVRSGVTTLVDQGGPSCMTLPGFRHFIVNGAKTRVLAYLSAYLVGGLEGHYYPSLYRPDCVDIAATVKAAQGSRDLVKGIKAHAEMGGFARWGIEVMQAAAEIGRQAELPVYLHFGQLWPLPHQGGRPVDPDLIFTQVLALMKPGDVLAHPFSRHPGGFVSTRGALHPMVKEAVARGLKIDVGHGSHFSFRMARTVLDAGVVPDTLGADMHGHNTRVAPLQSSRADAGEHLFAGKTPFSLVSAMTSMLALGLPLNHVVRMVTVNAAALVGMQEELGRLRVDGMADVSVLSDTRGRWLLNDDEGTTIEATRLLRPLFCLRGGVRFDADAEILPVLRAA